MAALDVHHETHQTPSATGHRSLSSSPSSSLRTAQEQWRNVCQLMQQRLDNAVYQRWIGNLQVIDATDNSLSLAMPTRFMVDWVERHYADQLRLLWKQKGGKGDLRFVVMNPLVQKAAPATTLSPTAATPASTSADLSVSLDPRFTFENFVVGKPNELAYAAARRVAESPTPAYNPLFLYGGVGLGKTHLMHAIAWSLREQQPQKRVVYLSAEKFMYQFVRALRFKDMVAFKDQFRNVDVLMIDDVQFICGREHTQEEFFHTFNALVDANRQVIISADKSPQDLEAIEERLRSRLGWGLVADVNPTTYELRLSILQNKCDQLKQTVTTDVLELLAQKITANVRELEGALNRVVAHSQLMGRDITLDMAQEVLADTLRAHERRITIDEIQRKVAEHYGIKLAEMHSARRARDVARPRQVAMYLAKQLTPRSLPEIGRKFGGRDHTTVIHAVKKIEELLGNDTSLNEDVQVLKRILQ
ncbi:MAG: chromosomal replication initiator protein DnaA [Alphaproteobacteria bacterium]|nr:chromosomal replication initiator protein DnaA [Alphaproteobacteria bacterium]NDG04063.1 chromosomal replication initiator protein DnaA [Alphaproteobacteria bacterium]